MYQTSFFGHSNISFFGIIFALLLYSGCRKQSDTNNIVNENAITQANDRDGKSHDSYALTTRNISVVNGMFSFDSYEDLEKIISSLDSLSYTESEDLEGIGYTSDDYLPEEPKLDLFNARFSVNSLRQELESLEKQEDETGTSLDEKINQILFWEPVLGSLISTYNEVRIKDLIYKYIDDNRLVVFQAGNSSLLQTLRNTIDPFTLENSINFFKVDMRKDDDVNFYRKIENANRGGECLFNVTWSNTNSLYSFHSIGFFPIGGSVTWKVIDANGQVLATQYGFSTFGFTLPVGTVYPVYVSIESEGCDPYRKIFASSPPSGNYDCSILDFDYVIDPILPNRVTFLVPPNTPTIYWNFGDGTTITLAPVGNIVNTITHIFPSDANATEYVVCASVGTDFCSNTICKTVLTTGCGSSSNAKTYDKGIYKIGVTDEYQYKNKIKYKDPLFARPFVYAKIKTRKQAIAGFPKHRRWNHKVNGFDVFWNSTNPSGGDGVVRSFDSSCTDNTQVCIGINTNKSKIKLKRKLPSGSKMRKIDINCNFYIRDFSPQEIFIKNLKIN